MQDFLQRREFITLIGGAAVAWPIPALAQQGVPKIGVLAYSGSNWLDPFRKGLSEAGYIEGRNISIEVRSAEQYGVDKVSSLAAGLVRDRVEVVAALGGLAAPAAKAATATIPTVFCVGGDPVELGLVPSFNRPGGNITGVTFFATQLLQKQVGILHELVPKAKLVAALINPQNPRYQTDRSELQIAARTLGLELHVANASREEDLDPAFDSLVQQHAQALIVMGDGFLFRARTKLVALAEQHAIPSMFMSREYADVGGLITYATSLADAHRQAGIYVGRILKGEKPGDLPVLQPTKFEMVINMKTAKALGLTVSDQLQFLADDVIE